MWTPSILVELLVIFHVNFQDTDPNVKSSQEVFHFHVNILDTDFDLESSQLLDEVISLVFGFFTLLVPSGLGLYW
jgi:membrane protein insertase Oxa1/YidC/SpoIIIJ